MLNLKNFVASCCGKESGVTPEVAAAQSANRPRPASAKSSGSAKSGASKKVSIVGMKDNVGVRVDDQYQRDKKTLGEGSYGTVSIAKHKASGQTRAIKSIVKAKVAKTKQQQQRLQVEIDIMKVCDHPGIVKLYETFEDSKSIYLVMDLSTGGELFDRIVEAQKFTEKDAAVVMQQMLGAIFYLHSNNVCHRDLKPENFLFVDKSPIATNTLKLIDFGLSCQFKPGQRFKTKAGTPYYVAPQVLAGDYDQASDLWSCGVIMFVLLCGYPPFYADNDPEVLAAVRKGKFEYSKDDWRNISPDAKDLIKDKTAPGLIEMDEKRRLTASQALQHNWIKNTAPGAKQVNLSGGIVDNLRNFAKVNKLKKAALHVIAGQLNDGQVKALRDLFIAIDTNGDGMLSQEELKNGVQKAGIKLDPEMLALIEELDADQSGSIDYTEFIAAAVDMKTATQEDKCRAAFAIFDVNGDGKISMSELKALLEEEGVSAALGDKAAEEVMKEVDANGDGEIDFKEFMAMMRKK